MTLKEFSPYQTRGPPAIAFPPATNRWNGAGPADGTVAGSRRTCMQCRPGAAVCIFARRWFALNLIGTCAFLLACMHLAESYARPTGGVPSPPIRNSPAAAKFAVLFLPRSPVRVGFRRGTDGDRCSQSHIHAWNVTFTRGKVAKPIIYLSIY